MEYQENLEIYLNLSRKELQSLCKSHNLPANRSHVQLAKSLASCFKKKNALAKGKLNIHVEASFNKSSSLEPKVNQTVYLPKEATRGQQLEAVVGALEKQPISSDSDIYRMTCSPKEMVGSDDRPLQTGNQLQIINQSGSQGRAAAIEVVGQYPVNSRGTKGSGGSLSDSEALGARHLAASDVQGSPTNKEPVVGCYEEIKVRQTQKASLQKIPSQRMQDHAATNTALNSCAVVPCEQQISFEGSRASALVSSDKMLTKAAPSFQFFAMSEDGINLYVDLNSSISEWISNMKDEVKVSRNGHQQPSTISNHIGGLADYDEHMRAPSSGMVMNLLSDGVVKNLGCTNSTLSSAVSEIHSEACASDPTAVTSRASELASSSFLVDIPGYFKGNKMFSSSRTTNFNIQSHRAFDVSSCPKGAASPQYLKDASFRMEKSNTVLFTDPLNPTSNISVPASEGSQNLDTKDCNFLKAASVHSTNGVSVSDNTMITVSEKNSLSVTNTSEPKMASSGICNIDNDVNSCQLSIGNELTEGFTKGAAQQDGSLSSSYLSRGLLSNCPVACVQPGTASADDFLNQQIKSSHGNSVTNDAVLRLNGELVITVAATGKEPLECSEFHNASEKNSKRSHLTEFPEEVLSKRQHAHIENKSGAIMNIRSTKVLAKETMCSPVIPPRRSTRLVSK